MRELEAALGSAWDLNTTSPNRSNELINGAVPSGRASFGEANKPNGFVGPLEVIGCGWDATSL